MLPAHRGSSTPGIAHGGAAPSSETWAAGSGSLVARLADPALYLAAAERLRDRQQQRGDPRPLLADGPSLAAVDDLPELARRLAREVARGDYRFEPIVPHAALLHGKLRTLYRARVLDDVVRTALADILADVLESFLSPHVFAYRRGRSSWSAIHALSNHLRAYAQDHPDPRTRGIYVLRRDIQGYGESIPCGRDSQLWSLLAEALAIAGTSAGPAQLAWLRGALRPPLAAPDSAGTVHTPERGIPTGSALQPAACNLYLTPLDRLIESIPGAFYARYGDDVVFAVDDARLAIQVQRVMDESITSLGLTPSPTKSAAYYLTSAGRASRDAPIFAAAQSIAYLGVSIEARGGVRLRPDRARTLLREVSLRLRQSMPLLAALAPRERARGLCAIVNAALDPAHPGACASAGVLCHAVDDRPALQDLDNKLALLVARQLAARSGVRAFRSHPPRELRALGLLSLVERRNHAGARAATARV